MNILVLGATGFIGRNITEKLALNPDYNVYAVNFRSPQYESRNVKWLNVNLCEIEQVKGLFNTFDIVIQAAATTSGADEIINRPETHVTDNAIMNSLILREISNQNVKHFIFFSCTTMYQSNSEKKQKENDFDRNLPIYDKYMGVGYTKIYIENLCEFYSKLCNTKFSVIRHTNVYGPYDKFDLKRSHVMGATITKVMQSNDSIEVWGTGSEIRDLLYIDDLVELVQLVFQKQKDKFLIFNAGSDQGISVTELVNKVCHAANKHLKILYRKDKPNLDFSFISDSSKAYQKFGWVAQTSLEVGLNRTIKWWKNTYQSKE
jgi:nucleoside-diphosphate-sugar epimerase